jgi:hypothetical protein
MPSCSGGLGVVMPKRDGSPTGGELRRLRVLDRIAESRAAWLERMSLLFGVDEAGADELAAASDAEHDELRRSFEEGEPE